jgi:hypothetical protein
MKNTTNQSKNDKNISATQKAGQHGHSDSQSQKIWTFRLPIKQKPGHSDCQSNEHLDIQIVSQIRYGQEKINKTDSNIIEICQPHKKRQPIYSACQLK